MVIDTEQIENFFDGLCDPGIYFLFIGMLNNKKFTILVNTCNNPIFLWDLFCSLCDDENLKNKNNFEIMDAWLNRTFRKKLHYNIKKEFSNLGGCCNDWEVFYNVFLLSLVNYLKGVQLDPICYNINF